MRTLPILLLLAGTATLPAQPTLPQVTARGPHHNVWSWETEASLPDGRKVREAHGFVELATGLNREIDGAYVPAGESIELAPEGAVARSGQMQVRFASQLRTFGAVDATTPDGRRLRSHVLGLALYDMATGQSVMIAEVKDCIGAVLPPNQVIYRDAFDGNVSGAIVYTYRRGSFHQDVVLRAQLPDEATPEHFGFDPGTTVLEVWTEMVDAQEPRRWSRPPAAFLQARNNPQAPVLPLPDDELDFGITRMVAGRAFAAGSAEDLSGDAVPVAKSWQRIGDRQCLVEALPYLALKAELENRLPRARADAGNQRAAVRPRRVLPAPPLQAGINPPGHGIAMASLSPSMRAGAAERGFVIDYQQIITATNVVLASDTTFLVSGPCNFYGTTVIEGGTVVKFVHTTNGTANISLQGVDCRTSPFRPAVFTAKDDNTLGEIIPGSTGNPGGYYGQGLVANATNSLHDLRFFNMSCGLGSGYTALVDLVNAQFRRCSTAVSPSYSAWFYLHNVLVSECGTAFAAGGSSGSRVEHATVDRVNYLYSGYPYNLHLTNSLLVSVSNNVTYSGTNVTVLSPGTGVFQTVGGGGHYLADNSPHRDAGTTNISAAMRAAFQNLTTYPPVLLNNPITADTVLSPQAGRDLDLPDLGYHYAPLDFLVSAVTVSSNATVLATNGVVIGIDYFVTNSWGFLLAPGKFISQGSPVAMNRVVRAHTVQEKASGNPATRAVFYDGNTPGGSASTLRARFTEFDQLASDGPLLSSGTKLNAMELSHSALYNPTLVVDFSGTGTLVVGLTNTLWERGGVQLGTSTASAGKVVHGRNNLWRGTSLLFYGGNTNWTVADDIFDRMFSLTNINGSVRNYTNAWYLTNYGLSGGLGIIQLTSLTYAPGPLGNYYRPTNSTQLINKGSRTAALAQLYHFTTTTDQVKETNSLVDIGHHYIAVTNIASIWRPIDTDGDGVPDYVEDANGNGTVDAGERSWIAAPAQQSDSGGVLRLQLHTPVK